MREAIFGITILEAAIVYVCEVGGEEMGFIGLLRGGWRCRQAKQRRDCVCGLGRFLIIKEGEVGKESSVDGEGEKFSRGRLMLS
jgi:hypothetical protein